MENANPTSASDFERSDEEVTSPMMALHGE
jgi:hypothetical protein